MATNDRRGLRLRWKIVGPYAVLALVGALFGAYFVTRLVVGSLDERFTNQLVEASRVAADAIVRQEQDHLAAIRAISFTEGFAEAIQSSSDSEIEAITLPVVANLHVERVEVLDVRGNRMYGAGFDGTRHGSLSDPIARGDWPFVRRTLDPTGSKGGKLG